MAGLGGKMPRGAMPESCEPKQLRICLAPKGATFSASLGQRPRIRGTPKQRQR
jgi:hypothetical protein